MQRTDWLATAAVAALIAAPASAQAPQKPAPKAPAKPAATVGEVVVTGTAPPVRTSIDRQSYSVASDLQATTGSISDALRNVPSVEVDVQGNVSLRGDPNVTIYIDGKPSGRFRGENKAQALQNLPARSIDRVEVITNPSAAFNPEGTGGIINLVTKKTARPGVSGGIRANLGTRDRQNGGASLTYRAGKVTWSGDLYLRHDTQRQRFNGVRTFADSAGTGQAVETQTLRGAGEGVSVLSARIGADYDPDANTRIGIETHLTAIRFNIDNVERVDQIGANGISRLGYDGFAGLNQDRENIETRLTYRRELGGDRVLDVSVSGEVGDENRDRPSLRIFQTPAPAIAFDNPVTRNYLRRVQVKADWSDTLSGGVKLKLGYEFNGDDNDYRLVYARSAGGGPLFLDATRSNLFRFNQQVHAAYGTWEQPLGKKLTVLAGLRAETTRIELDQVTQAITSSRDYARLYPSLHLGYQLDDNRNLSASYSHRVQRPQPGDYNPFRVVQERNVSQGNPDLRPQQSDSFELGYQYRKMGTILLATGYYRRGRDSVNDVYRDLGGGLILQTKANVGSFETVGLETVLNGRLTPKLRYNVSGNVFHSRIDAGNVGFGGRELATTTASGRASLTWSPTDRDILQAQGQLQGKRLLSQGYARGWGMLNLGYRHKFTDTLSGVVTLNDVLNTATFGSVITTASYTDRSRSKPGMQAVFVGFTWNFGGRGRGGAQDFDYGSAPAG